MAAPFDPASPFGDPALVRALEQALLSCFDEDSSAKDSEKLEIELRVGRVNPDGSFSPGLSQGEYDKIMKRLLKRLKSRKWSRFAEFSQLVGFTDPASDLMDVSIENWRVSLDVKRKKIIEIISKERFFARDFKATDGFDLRLSMATETKMFSGDSEFKRLAKLALNACDSDKVADSSSIEEIVESVARGAICGLKTKGINPAWISLASPDLPPIRSDPIRDSTPDPSLLFKKLSQLRWTIVSPESLLALESRGSLRLSESKLPRSLPNFKCQFTNLPGRYRHAGNYVPVPMGAYTMNAPLSSIRILSEGLNESGPSLFRRKKRYSFLLGKGFKLDCTQIQSSTRSYKDCLSSLRTFEMEIEWLFPDFELKRESVPKAVLRTVSEALKCFYDSEAPRLPSQFEWSSTGSSRLLAKHRQRQIVEESRSSYSSLKRANASDRSKSRIFHLKNLNNFVKSTLLNEAARRSGLARGRVLDLACGKGGDFAKLCNAYAKPSVLTEYVGVDVADGSLEDFEKRLRDGMSTKFPNTKHTLINLDLTSTDLSRPNLKARVLCDGKFKAERAYEFFKKAAFDVVTIQFALHYLFTSQESALTFFSNVRAMLRPGGSFVATTVNCDNLVYRLMQDSNKSKVYLKDVDERELCVASFPKSTLNKLKRGEIFGLEYEFKLLDAPDSKAVNATEFLVPSKALELVAQKAGLNLKTHVPLLTYASENFNADLFESFKVFDSKGRISDLEREVASLYCVVEMERPAIDESAFVAKLLELSSSIQNFNDLPSHEQTRLVNAAL